MNVTMESIAAVTKPDTIDGDSLAAYWMAKAEKLAEKVVELENTIGAMNRVANMKEARS